MTVAENKQTSKKKTGLGKGIESLIPTHVIQSEFDPSSGDDKKFSRAKNVLIQDVFPNPDQPRKQFKEDELTELAQSIDNFGILQPLVVIETDDGFQIVAGERRWRAAQQVGLEMLPVLVRSFDEQMLLEAALIENLQREDLTPLEMATAYFKLVDHHNQSHEQIGERVGKHKTTISNTIRLLSLPEEAKQALHDGKIKEAHARAILALDGKPEHQQELLRLIIANDWTIRQAEKYVVAVKKGASRTTAVQKVQSETPETKKLAKSLGAKVWIHNMAKGGRLIIEYKNEDDLKRITSDLSN